MYLVRLKNPRAAKVPLRSGRIVEFGGTDQHCITEEEYVEHKFHIVGKCDQPEVVKAPVLKGMKKPCKSCQEKKGGSMRCDFKKKARGQICIRCNVSVSDQITYMSCKTSGWGDKIAWLTGKLRIPMCVSCSNRRKWLNELDREIYREWHDGQATQESTSPPAGRLSYAWSATKVLGRRISRRFGPGELG